MVRDEEHTAATRLLREQGGTAPGTRGLIPTWLVVRQLRSKDRFALGKATPRRRQAILDPRTREVDEGVRGIVRRQGQRKAQKWPELCMTPRDSGGIMNM